MDQVEPFGSRIFAREIRELIGHFKGRKMGNVSFCGAPGCGPDVCLTPKGPSCVPGSATHRLILVYALFFFQYIQLEKTMCRIVDGRLAMRVVKRQCAMCELQRAGNDEVFLQNAESVD